MMTIEAAIMFLAEPYVNDPSPRVTRAAEAIAVIKDRLAALQRMADATKQVLEMVTGDTGSAALDVALRTARTALRTLESTDGQ